MAQREFAFMKWPLVGSALFWAIVPVWAGNLGNRVNTFEDMHTTPYGSLFFVEGAAHDWEIGDNHAFVALNGDGNVSLPRQPNGYCFAFNHYNPAITSRLSRTYRARIHKTRAGGVSSEPFSDEFIPTPDPTSQAVPSLCISGLANVSSIAIEFRSEAGPIFTRAISFQVGP